jgi:hypothetical protein
MDHGTRAGIWRVGGEVHGIEALWTYVRQLFLTHEEWLAANTKCDWTIDPDTDTWVQIVQNGDARSTFFRYPTTNRLTDDAGEVDHEGSD